MTEEDWENKKVALVNDLQALPAGKLLLLFREFFSKEWEGCSNNQDKNRNEEEGFLSMVLADGGVLPGGAFLLGIYHPDRLIKLLIGLYAAQLSDVNKIHDPAHTKRQKGDRALIRFRHLVKAKLHPKHHANREIPMPPAILGELFLKHLSEDDRVFWEDLSQMAESYFREFFCNKLAEVYVVASFEALHYATSKGKISKKRLRELKAALPFFESGFEITKRDRETRSKYNVTHSMSMQLDQHYKVLNPLYRDTKSQFRKASLRTEVGFDHWCEMINAEFRKSKGVELEKDLMGYWWHHDEKTYIYDYRPANQAIEHAARLSINGYKKRSLTPRELMKYLPKKDHTQSKTHTKQKP